MNSLTLLIVQWFVSAFALWATSLVVPGFRLKNYGSALVASLVIGLANNSVWYLIAFLTLPLTILTLGLFLFVVNAIVLRICAAILKDFDITNWLSAIIGAVVLSVLNYICHTLVI